MFVGIVPMWSVTAAYGQDNSMVKAMLNAANQKPLSSIVLLKMCGHYNADQHLRIH